MLGQRRRRWASFELALGKCLVFAVLTALIKVRQAAKGIIIYVRPAASSTST